MHPDASLSSAPDRYGFALAVLLVILGGPITAAAEVEVLDVRPDTIQLGGANRRQQILVTAQVATGSPVDVTHDCSLTIEDAQCTVLDGAVICGIADGRTELVVRYGGREQRVPVIVSGFERYPPVNFANDVIPVFSKLGCNSGGCHGKRSGQNGFRLSVFGFDPQADFDALTKEARGRRVFPADPEQSLLLLKATGRVAHGGGRRTDSGSPDCELLTQWVRQGMPWGAAEAPRLTELRVEPADRVMPRQAGQQILVTALYSDGSERDVTAAAAYTSNAEVIAEVDAGGRIRTGQIPGEAAVTVNYMGHVGVVRVLGESCACCSDNECPATWAHHPCIQELFDDTHQRVFYCSRRGRTKRVCSHTGRRRPHTGTTGQHNLQGHIRTRHNVEEWPLGG